MNTIDRSLNKCSVDAVASGDSGQRIQEHVQHQECQLLPAAARGAESVDLISDQARMNLQSNLMKASRSVEHCWISEVVAGKLPIVPLGHCKRRDGRPEFFFRLRPFELGQLIKLSSSHSKVCDDRGPFHALSAGGATAERGDPTPSSQETPNNNRSTSKSASSVIKLFGSPFSSPRSKSGSSTGSMGSRRTRAAQKSQEPTTYHVVIVDIRTEDDFHKKHIRGAINNPRATGKWPTLGKELRAKGIDYLNGPP